MAARLVTVLFLCLLAAAPQAAAADDGARALPSGVHLLMVEEAGCSYCERWHAEIGPVYSKTPEGRFAPLVVRDISGKAVRSLPDVVYTPTFIVRDGRREVGRILGYPGEDFFWPMLGAILDDIGFELTTTATADGSPS